MKAKQLSIARLSSEERQSIVEAIRQLDFLHKDMVLEIFAFLEILLKDLKDSKMTAAILRNRLLGFISEQEKKRSRVCSLVSRLCVHKEREEETPSSRGRQTWLC